MRRSTLLAISLIPLLALNASASAFAACEKERAEYQTRKAIYETLAGVTEAAAIGGMVGGAYLAPITGGISAVVGGLIAGPPALATRNAHRIMEEKLSNLINCEAQAKAAVDANDHSTQVELEKEKLINDSIHIVNSLFDEWRVSAESKLSQDMENYFAALIHQDIDISSPEVQANIAEKEAALIAKFQSDLEKRDRLRRKNIQWLRQGVIN